MKTVLKYSKPYIPMVIVAILLLFVQANLNLALPDYLSDIVNTGIQQGGSRIILRDQVTQDRSTEGAQQPSRRRPEGREDLTSQTTRKRDPALERVRRMLDELLDICETMQNARKGSTRQGKSPASRAKAG